MKKKVFKAFPFLLLTLLGIIAIFTGLFKDEKIFYAVGAVCLSLSSIYWFLTSFPSIRMMKTTQKKFLEALPLLLLTLLGSITIFTGLFKDEKIFYAVGAVCLSFSSIYWFLISRQL